MKGWLRLWSVCLLASLALPAYGQKTVQYFHTDALGSVVAVTDASGALIERREYEPYGAQLTPLVQDGPGYTGHVQDAVTGLVYMQQRYYDPVMGKFLSVDPVTAYGSGDWRQLNRYAYAYNNPHKFTDPDGRFPLVAVPVAIEACAASVVCGAAAIATGAYVGKKVGDGVSALRSYIQQNEAYPESASDAVTDLIDQITKPKRPADGEAGQAGELQGEEGEGQADWEKVREFPGAKVNNDSNILLPDGTNVNRHDSTRPFNNGPPAGTDTIKIYRPGSKIPTTFRYPRRPKS